MSAGERHRVIVGRPRNREAFRACHFCDPRLVDIERLEPVLEMLAVDALLSFSGRPCGGTPAWSAAIEERAHLVEIGVLEIDDDVPAELGDLCCDALHHILRRRIDQALDEIETDAFHAGLVQFFSSASVMSSPTKATPLALPLE